MLTVFRVIVGAIISYKILETCLPEMIIKKAMLSVICAFYDKNWRGYTI